MAKKTNSPFESSEGRLLLWLKEHQIETASGLMAKFTQKELAEEYGVSISTINALLQLLVRLRCVELIRSGRYQVTETGNLVIEKMDEIKNILGGSDHVD